MKAPKHPGTPLPSFYSVKAAEGDAPVQDWLAQIPDWQAESARQIDASVSEVIPDVRKAVKSHGVWYGRPGAGWFLALNTFKAQLKLTFFNGCDLLPVPPDVLAQKPAIALDLREKMPLDTGRIADWIGQAQAFPGIFKA